MEYLAGPYTHEDPTMVQQRYEAHRKAAAQLSLKGKIVFSPIVQGHNLLPELDAWRHDEWMRFDYGVLRHCSKMYVLQIDGWQESKGTQAEIEFAKSYGIPIEFIPGESP